jgi:hypothetical protein
VDRLAHIVARRVLAREVRILIDRDETKSVYKPPSRCAIVGTFESPFSLYRVFDGEELRRSLKSNRITGGIYAVPLERQYGASWGEDISQVISWGNQQRGRRLGDDLFLAKIDADGRRFFHLNLPDVPFDPNGPESQPATMNVSKCSTGLGCSIVNVAFNDAQIFTVSREGQISAANDADLQAYLKAKPQKPVELRSVSQVAAHGSILGVDVVVRMTQGADQLYYQTWGVYNADGGQRPIVVGAKTKEIAIAQAAKLIKAGENYGEPLDLLPKSVRKKWEKMQPHRPKFFASVTVLRVAARYGEEKPTPMSMRVAARHFIAKNYFEVGDIVLVGKYKNGRGKIVAFGQDKWGNPTIEVEPIPKGRKQNKIIGLYKVWRADVKENVLKKQQAEEAAAEGGAP